MLNTDPRSCPRTAGCTESTDLRFPSWFTAGYSCDSVAKGLRGNLNCLLCEDWVLSNYLDTNSTGFRFQSKSLRSNTKTKRFHLEATILISSKNCISSLIYLISSNVISVFNAFIYLFVCLHFSLTLLNYSRFIWQRDPSLQYLIASFMLFCSNNITLTCNCSTRRTALKRFGLLFWRRRVVFPFADSVMLWSLRFFVSTQNDVTTLSINTICRLRSHTIISQDATLDIGDCWPVISVEKLISILTKVSHMSHYYWQIVRLGCLWLFWFFVLILNQWCHTNFCSFTICSVHLICSGLVQ